MVSIQFLGGADTVTGSKFLARDNGGSVMVDCGLFQGPRPVRELNWDDPFLTGVMPDEVLLTHAHIDHTGYLPRLVGTHGYDGQVYCTAATADLLTVMLPDSGRLQEEQARYANKKGYSRHKPALPLYTEEHAHLALGLLRPVAYDDWIEVACGRARLVPAGHILGSAHITIEKEGRSVTFSGDVGRWDIPVLRDPQPPGPADLLLLESTYGGRHHLAGDDPNDLLADVVTRAAARDGALVIPAFSIGRTQEILYRLRSLEDAGQIPTLPVFLDSPMAIDATEIYSRHHDEHDLAHTELEDQGRNPLRPRRLEVTRTVDQSKRLNGMREAMIVISASGMATGGRVVHHLKRRLPWPENIVAFVGYQAVGTLGRELVEGADRVRIHGDDHEVRADVVRLESFSAHADEGELMRWVGDNPSRRIALVHGEDGPRQALARRFAEVHPGVEVLLPRRGETVEV